MTLGVPYPEGYDQQAVADMQKQAEIIADDLKANESQLLLGENGIQANQEIIALIAYMQKLGADIEMANTTTNANSQPKP
jgi:cytochrome c oxidase cbb3-type subunit I/II